MGNTTASSTTVMIDFADDTNPKRLWGNALSPAHQPVVFQLLDSQLSITVPLRERIVIGRRADHNATPIDVDLAPHEAFKKGVSRQHATLTRVYRNLFLTDLGSANGTYLNGQKLVPYQERLVRDGDEIKLGNLRLCLHFDEAKEAKTI
jgi:pSer/pThr/pTyr-binding forkhead associated (FHA) protein